MTSKPSASSAPLTKAPSTKAAQIHQSPAQQAWSRLARNKLAMLGLITVCAWGIMCFAAPVFSQQDPDYRRSWVGSLPPGSISWDARSENIFRVGAAPQLPALSADTHSIRLHCYQEHSNTFIITRYRRGRRAGQIKKISGSGFQYHSLQHLKTLDLDTHFVRADAHANNTAIPLATLHVRSPAPVGLFAADSHSITVRQRLDVPESTTHSDVAITLDQQLITHILVNDAPVDSFICTYKDIVSLHVDGVSAHARHMLGTDAGGRDVWSRILYGGRISLSVGLVATIVSLCIGVVYGAYSGYVGGRTDRLMMSFVDMLYAIPFMFIVILLLVMFGRNILILFAALGAVQWLTTARIVRGQVLSLKSREFIEAAHVNGASRACILYRHLLPNCIGPIIVYATLTVPAVILEESFLAFLGLQVEWGDRKLDSWGYLVHEGIKTINFNNGDFWWVLVFPSLAMTLTLLGLNTLGDGLRDALDPQGAHHD